MAHGLNSELKRAETKTGIGSRRIFPPHFKLQVLDSYRNDADCKGNQRATARKYGIHRRQIQKWLQAESNLRNSVAKPSKTVVECEPRKCGIELALRVTSHRQRDDSTADAYSQIADSRVPALGALNETVPLDFTTHSRTEPIDLSLHKRPTHVYTPIPSPPTYYNINPPQTISQDPDIWDLSIKPQKRKLQETTTTPKPIKLFKPYLDELHDTSNSSDDVKPQTFCNNYYEPYTLHELQPNTYYYQPLYQDYYDPNELQPLKQRQTYSLDFKLSAIESYYQDESCRGNQRAVATKYNIHRRQVQKWLKQEEELRLRNDSLQPINTIT